MPHDIEVCDEAEATVRVLPDMYLILSSCQLPMPDPLSLFKCALIEGFIVVCLGDVLGLGAPLEVHESRVAARIAHLVPHVTENVEQVFIIVFGEFDLLRQVVLCVAVGAALSWLVRSVLFGAHCHYVFDSLLDDCSLEIIDIQDELEQLAQFTLRVGQNVLKPEEVHRFVRLFGQIDPVAEPELVSRGAPLLKVDPVGLDRILGELLLELARVRLREHQVEKRRVDIELIPRAHNGYIVGPFPLEGQHVGEVRFLDPAALIGDAFGLEATELQRDIGRVFQDHV